MAIAPTFVLVIKLSQVKQCDQVKSGQEAGAQGINVCKQNFVIVRSKGILHNEIHIGFMFMSGGGDPQYLVGIPALMVVFAYEMMATGAEVKNGFACRIR